MIPVSDEAVEAAAEVLYKRDRALLVPWGDTALPDIRAYRDEARAALEAAAPYMLAGAWSGGYDRGTDLAAWAIGNRPQSERPDTTNPYRSQA